MRGCKSKDRQYNEHKKQDNETSNYTDKLKITNILGTTSKPNTGIPHVLIAKVNAKMAITFIIIPADA
jgi:hypothetical protein